MNTSSISRLKVLWLPLLLVCIGLIFIVDSPSPTELRLVLPRLPIDRELADEFALLLDQEADVTIRQVQLGEPDKGELHALLVGEADLAMVSNKEAFHPDIGTVVPLYPRVLHIAYRANVQAEDLQSLLLAGSVDAGPPGSDARMFLEQSLALFEMSMEQVNLVMDQNCADVTVLYAPISGKVDEQFERCGKYRLFSLGELNDLGRGSLVDALMLQNPRVRPFVIPRRIYGDLSPEPVLTLAVDQLLVAHESVAEADVYDLMSEIQRLQHAIAGQHPAIFDNLTESFSGSKSTFALHQGTQAFLERDEPDLMERYSGVAEVLVTLLVGVISGGYAMFRLYQVRQKDRIDEFYEQIIVIRDSLSDENPPDYESVRFKVRELQDRALTMLIDEKLAGDESFRIFMGLGNDLLDDLRQGKSPTDAADRNAHGDGSATVSQDTV